MRIAVISDLHLSPVAASCAFTHPEGAAIAAVERLMGEGDRLVIAGDLFDLDHSPRLWDRAAGLGLARERWANLLGTLDDPRVDLIHGNHDRLLAEEGIPDRLELGPAGGRSLIIHGHQLRRGWQLREGVKAPVKWGAARMLVGGMAPLGRGIQALNEAKEALEARGAAPLGGALLAERRDLAMVVTGHTHRPGVWRVGEGILANSGSWAYGRADVLTLDLERGEAHHQERWDLFR